MLPGTTTFEEVSWIWIAKAAPGLGNDAAADPSPASPCAAALTGPFAATLPPQVTALGYFCAGSEVFAVCFPESGI